MSSLIDSINEKRQLQRKIEFEEAWFESAFGKKNSKLIKDIAESDTKGPAYDPKNPNNPASLALNLNGFKLPGLLGFLGS